jgi:hypothetical protein
MGVIDLARSSSWVPRINGSLRIDLCISWRLSEQRRHNYIQNITRLDNTAHKTPVMMQIKDPCHEVEEEENLEDNCVALGRAPVRLFGGADCMCASKASFPAATISSILSSGARSVVWNDGGWVTHRDRCETVKARWWKMQKKKKRQGTGGD